MNLRCVEPWQGQSLDEKPYRIAPRTYDKKPLNWALGQESLKAYIRIPYIRAYSGVLKGAILDPRFLI